MEGSQTRTRKEKGPKQVRNAESFIHTIKYLLLTVAAINNASVLLVTMILSSVAFLAILTMLARTNYADTIAAAGQ